MSSHQTSEKWDTAKSTRFWDERVFQSVSRNDNIANRLESRKTQIESREQSQGLYKTQFKVQFQEFLLAQQSRKLTGPVITDNLRFWIEHLSWTYCNTCKVLKMQRLLPNYFKRPSIKYANDCTCIKKV